jgi:hypothetical protein
MRVRKGKLGYSCKGPIAVLLLQLIFGQLIIKKEVIWLSLDILLMTRGCLKAAF